LVNLFGVRGHSLKLQTGGHGEEYVRANQKGREVERGRKANDQKKERGGLRVQGGELHSLLVLKGKKGLGS